MVYYDDARLKSSVENTRQILHAHALDSRSRVIVCHPFDPWSIGGVFRDAALACGALVLPLGLNATDQSLWPIIAAFKPTVLFGSASLLISLRSGITGAGIRIPQSRRLIFHAGEPLTPTAREACGVLWDAKLIDVYGSAELDSIASEGLYDDGLILCPGRNYSIAGRATGVRLPLETGMEGELLVQNIEDGTWFRTRDRVLVLERATSADGLWPGSWKIRHTGRSDHSLSLADGTILQSRCLVNIARRLPIQGIQVHSSRISGKSTLRLLAVPLRRKSDLDPEMLRTALLSECFELADSVKHGASTLVVEFVRLSQLHRTSRGKVATFVEH